MKLSALISTDVNLVRVTQVQEGDCYKRIHERSSYDKELITSYGIITDIAVTDNMQLITVLEFTDDYTNSGKLTRRSFSGESEHILFPVEDEEFQISIERMREKAIESLETAQSQLRKAEQIYGLVAKVSDMALEGIKSVNYQIAE